ncbi:MAG: AMP-binding protein, partial [Longimicrobiales bacterium]
MLATDFNLGSTFLRVARAHGDRPALVLPGRSVTYAELAQTAADWAATAIGAEPEVTPLIGVLACRSLPAYAGIWAALIAGRGYLPLNPAHPVARTRQMLESSGSRVVIVGAEGLALLDTLADAPQPYTFLLADQTDASKWHRKFPQHRFIASPHFLRNGALPDDVTVDDAAIAYLLFTSGSTGEPKGVAVTHANVASYTRYITERHGITEQDRFSQMPDLTFDLSIQDLFPCWTRGAALHVVPRKATFSPATFIREHDITIWTS